LKKTTFYLACLLLVVGASAGASDVRYRITDLSPLVDARAINSSNQVAGYLVGDYYYPMLWNNGSVVRLQPVAIGGCAYDINNHGLVVGGSDSRAVTWDPAGHVTYLPLQAGTRSSAATDVNEYGTAAGYFLNSENLAHACYWQNGTFTDMGVPYGNQSVVCALNNMGAIVVESDYRLRYAYIYSQGQFAPMLTDLTNVENSYARCINDAGMVVGFAEMWDGTQVGYQWQDGVTTVLPTPTGKDRPCPLAVNNAGVAVGSAWLWPHGESARACIWDGQQVSFLNDLIPADSGWTLQDANDINDLGQIVGSGTLGGVTRAFLLTPIPEPSSVLALLSGLAGIGGMVVRRRK